MRYSIEDPQSRFTLAPAIAIVPDEETAMEVSERDDPRAEAVRQLVGEWILEEDDDVGAPNTVDGSSGLGAEAWAVILVWEALRGIVGGASWDLTKAAARQLSEKISRARASEGGVTQVSKGAARYIAIGYIIDHFRDEDGPLDVQSIEEPSTMGGHGPMALNYIASEPWIVVLVNAALTHRYVVVVTPDGEVAAANRLELRTAEAFSGVRVEIPGGTDSERDNAKRRARDEGRGPWRIFRE